MTILESGEDEPGPADFFATLFSKIMIANAGKNAVNSSNQFWVRARSGAKPYRIVTAIKKISSGASMLIRYQRSGTRQRKLRRARSRTPAFPLTRAATINAGRADPRTFSSTPCGVAPPGRSPGSVSPLGTKTRAVVVAYTSTKKVAIGCLMIHDLSGETFAAPTSAAGSAMIGAPLGSGSSRWGVRAGHRPSRQLHIVEREAVEGHQMTLSTGQLLNHGQWSELPFWIVSGCRRWVGWRHL
jgi:hypothetical protein